MSYPLPVNDPQHNNQPVVVQGTIGGNAQLEPTTSRTSTLGIEWSPPEIEGLSASLTWWRLQIENGINLPEAQYIVDNENFYPGRVTRAPDGQIASVDYSYINYGTMREEGSDGKIDWRIRTRLGDVTPAIAATYMSEFKGSSTAGAPVVDRLSHANYDGIFAPQWKGIASITWNPRPAFSVWVDGRYIGRYWDYTPTRTIGNIWYLDASVEVGLEQALNRPNGSLAGLKLLLSGTNLADRLPVYSTYFRGYDVSNYDLIGRTFYARLQLQW
jgi:outer membrane receptor for ferrienterochelin and colicin